MDVLVTYDVSTETQAGKRRLRAVATACERFGQRVQKSVFECRVDRAQLEELEAAIQDIMNPETDSLRIYELHAPREECVRTYGVDDYTDFDDPLVL